MRLRAVEPVQPGCPRGAGRGAGIILAVAVYHCLSRSFLFYFISLVFSLSDVERAKFRLNILHTAAAAAGRPAASASCLLLLLPRESRLLRHSRSASPFSLHLCEATLT